LDAEIKNLEQWSQWHAWSRYNRLAEVEGLIKKAEVHRKREGVAAIVDAFPAFLEESQLSEERDDLLVLLQKARDRLLAGKELKIVYDDPWFWKVSAYKQQQRPDSRLAVKKPQATASIVFEEAEEPAKVTANPVTQKLPTNPQLQIPSRREKRNFKKPSGPPIGKQEEAEEGEIAN
jgi:hypothetical protein